MYLFNFSKFAGPDKVFLLSSAGKMKAGDFVKCGEDEFICLGNDISFSEMYTYTYRPTQEMRIIYKQLLSEKTIKLIHWMVYTYYSTYKSVMKYFVSDELEKLAAKAPKKTGKAEQTLHVYPDLRTLYNSEYVERLEDKGVVFLSSKDTQTKKDKQRWAIKLGLVNQIFVTPGEIFQDFEDLKKIVFIDPHKWYYANQQDPRYKVGAVLEEMKKLHGAELDIAGV